MRLAFCASATHQAQLMRAFPPHVTTLDELHLALNVLYSKHMELLDAKASQGGGDQVAVARDNVGRAYGAALDFAHKFKRYVAHDAE